MRKSFQERVACVACEATPNYSKWSSSHLLVPEFPQMTVPIFVLGETIFTEGGHYSLVNNVLWENIHQWIMSGGDTVHYHRKKILQSSEAPSLEQKKYFRPLSTQCLEVRLLTSRFGAGVPAATGRSVIAVVRRLSLLPFAHKCKRARTGLNWMASTKK